MKRTLILAIAASMLPFMAQAQTYNRLVSFGDSLTDNGNTFGLTGSPPAPYNKRFTNRVTWVEYLTGASSTATSGNLGMMITATPANVNSGSQDFAFGGARADNAANSNGPLPSSGTQINTFIALGGKFGANDVATLWSGANDLFQAFPGAAANPATATTVMGAAATTAATTVASQAATLAGAGAKTILVMNLPDFSSMPQFSAAAIGASGNQLAGFASSSYNSALKAGLTATATANSGANIITVDVASAFKVLVTNPQAFGLSNVTQTCISQAACLTGGATVQDTYLFWDGVHPTAAGHQLMAKIASQYLYAPSLASGVAMFADQSYVVRHSQMLALSDRMSQASSSEGDKGYFIELTGTDGKKTGTMATQSVVGGASGSISATDYDFSLYGARLGMTQGLGGNATWGIDLGVMTGKDTKGYLVSAKPTSINIDTMINWRSGPMFVNSSLGLGLDNYQNYTRQGLIQVFGLTKDNINATSVSGAVEAGMVHQMNDVTFTPVVRISYIKSRMGAFDEQGVVAPVSFAGRDVSAFSAAVELRGAAKLSADASLTGMIGYEGNLSSTEGALVGRLINNTSQPFSDTMAKMGNPGLIVGIGLEAPMGGGFRLGAGFRGTYGDHSQKVQTATLSLSRRF